MCLSSITEKVPYCDANAHPYLIVVVSSTQAFSLYHTPQLRNSDVVVLQQLLHSGLSDEASTDLGNLEEQIRVFVCGAVDVVALRQRLVAHATDNALQGTEPWLQKCTEIYLKSMTDRVMFVVGGPGTGKTTCLTSLTSVLDTMAGETGAHRVHHIHCGALSVADVIGHSVLPGNIRTPRKADDEHPEVPPSTWVDGYLTALLRKLYDSEGSPEVSRSIHTWIVLDCCTLAHAQMFSSAFRPNGSITLGNGDRLFLPAVRCASDWVPCYISTHHTTANPVILSRYGVLCFDLVGCAGCIRNEQARLHAS